MSQHNLKIVRGLYDAWSQDPEAFFAALDENVEWRFADNFVYGEVNPIIGREAVRSGSVRHLKTEWDDFDGIASEFLDAGDQVVVLGHYVGMYKATEKRMRAQFVHIWTLANDKITRWRQSVDTKAFADTMRK